MKAKITMGEREYYGMLLSNNCADGSLYDWYFEFDCENISSDIQAPMCFTSYEAAIADAYAHGIITIEIE